MCVIKTATNKKFELQMILYLSYPIIVGWHLISSNCIPKIVGCNSNVIDFLYFISGYFPLESVHCLVWMCLDVLFCTASIMHLCTISIDRYLSLRYPMRFGRNKTRKRVTVKIIFVWLLSIAMSLPLCLMYSKVSKIHKTQTPLPNHIPKL